MFNSKSSRWIAVVFRLHASKYVREEHQHQHTYFMKGLHAGFLAACLTLTILSGCGGSSHSDKPSASLVTVPNVIGLSQSEATASISAAGLVVGTITEQASDTVVAGKVIAQTPSNGSSVSKGSSVSLTISTGVSQSGTVLTSISVNSNPESSEFLTASVSDGSSISYFGSKDSSGKPSILSSFGVTEAGSAESRQFEFNSSGQLIWAGGGDSGYTFQFAWTNGVPSAVTVTTPDGNQKQSPLNWSSSAQAQGAAGLLTKKSARSVSALTLGRLSASSELSDAVCDLVQDTIDGTCQASEAIFLNPVAFCTAVSIAFIELSPAVEAACVVLLESGDKACQVFNASGGRGCDLVDYVTDKLTEPTLSLQASPTKLVPGQTALLSWRSTFATECRPSGGTGSDGWTSVVGLNGDLTLHMPLSTAPGTYSYAMTCTEGSRATPTRRADIAVVQYTTTAHVSVSPSALPAQGGQVRIYVVLGSDAPSGAIAPTGLIDFIDQQGNALCPSFTVTQSTALCDATIGQSPYTITARYSGDDFYSAVSGLAAVQLDTTSESSDDGAGVIKPGYYVGTLQTLLNCTGDMSGTPSNTYANEVEYVFSPSDPPSSSWYADGFRTQGGIMLPIIMSGFVSSPTSASTSFSTENQFTYHATSKYDSSTRKSETTGTETAKFSNGVLTVEGTFHEVGQNFAKLLDGSVVAADFDEGCSSKFVGTKL